MEWKKKKQYNKNYKPTGIPRGTHPNSIANLRPPTPGGEKHRRVEQTRTRLRKILGILQTAENPFTGEIEDYTTAELLDMAMVMKALKGDVKAYAEIIDRFEGKVTQRIEQENTIRSIIIDTTGTSQTASDIIDITPEEPKQIDFDGDNSGN